MFFEVSFPLLTWSRERFLDQSFLHEMFEDTTYGTFTDINIEVSLKDDGDLGFSIGGIFSSESENELFF